MDVSSPALNKFKAAVSLPKASRNDTSHRKRHLPALQLDQ